MQNRKNDNTKGRNRNTKGNRKSNSPKDNNQSVRRRTPEEKRQPEFSPEDAMS
jgi:hypothetical protein